MVLCFWLLPFCLPAPALQYLKQLSSVNITLFMFTNCKILEKLLFIIYWYACGFVLRYITISISISILWKMIKINDIINNLSLIKLSEVFNMIFLLLLFFYISYINVAAAQYTHQHCRGYKDFAHFPLLPYVWCGKSHSLHCLRCSFFNRYK